MQRRRMPSDERRAAILQAATEVFAERGYRGTSTAQLAEACGVTQPILYRHFVGKTELYLACLEQAWGQLHAVWEAALAREDDPGNFLPTLTVVGLKAINEAPGAKLWIRSLTDLHDDERIRARVRDNAHSAHEYVTGVVERAREGGGVGEHVNPRVEGWMFLSTGLLFALSHQLDDLVGEDFFLLLADRYRSIAPYH